MNDLISRQAAIDAIEKAVFKGVAIDAVNNLPSVEPKKGKWIDEGQYAEGHSERAYYCSICEKEYIGYIGEYNFCPNCGADMRETE